MSRVKTCRGPGVVVQRSADLAEARSPAPGGVELAIASILGESEARGEPVRAVVFEVRRSADVGWLEVAVPWVRRRGRSVVVKTRVPLPSSTVDVLATSGATVLLELASQRAPEQRRILPGADTAGKLLLHAQHLVGRGVPVGAWVTVHRGGRTAGLWRHVAGADLASAHIELRPEDRSDPAVHRRLESSLRLAEAHDEARGAGVRLDPCGCAWQCHLATTPVGRYVPITTPSLFSVAVPVTAAS